MRRAVIVLAAVAAVLLAAGVAASTPLIPEREVPSPDGEFRAIERTRAIDILFARMPGQGRDKPATITIYRKDGRSCGSAPLELAWMIDDLRWYLGGGHREARIVGVAEWDLDACTVNVFAR